MTPETRAARDRIAAFLTARPLMAQWTGRPEDFGDVITGAWPDAAEDTPGADLFVSDLQEVLAALDQQPDRILVTDAVLDQEQVEEFRRRFLAAQHDGVIRILDEPERAACADCARPIQYLDHPGWPTGWMHILEAADHEARPADHPA